MSEQVKKLNNLLHNQSFKAAYNLFSQLDTYTKSKVLHSFDEICLSKKGEKKTIFSGKAYKISREESKYGITRYTCNLITGNNHYPILSNVKVYVVDDAESEKNVIGAEYSWIGYNHNMDTQLFEYELNSNV